MNILQPQDNHSFQERNSKLTLWLFWLIIFFQLTILKNIWSIEIIAKFINIIITIIFSFLFLKTLQKKIEKKIWKYYIFPGMLICFGLFINIGRNIITNLELISYLGFLVPWIAYISIYWFIKREMINYRLLWLYFYYFMLFSMSFGILEYYLIFQGNMELDTIPLQNSSFLASYASIYHKLPDGTPHYRFYGNFLEPGTLAMWLLPVIQYAFLYKKYFGLIIFVIALILTDSLGGYISFFLMILINLLTMLNLKVKNVYLATFLTMILAILGMSYSSSYFSAAYEHKQNDTTRENNVLISVDKIKALFENPLGIKLSEDTNSSLLNEAYIGSNFMPILYFQNGGILAFCGYVYILIFNLLFSIKKIFNRDLTIEDKTVFLSIIFLFPYLVQRTTIYENAIYAFLFAPIILKNLKKIHN